MTFKNLTIKKDIPEAALFDITNAAKTSLLLTPDDSIPVQSFTNIKQGVDELFIKFVDCLKDDLEKQSESREAKKEMFIKLAKMNANTDTKTILRSLPLEPEPTIDQMIEVCVKHTSTENTVAQAVYKGIAEGVSGAFAGVAAKENQRCFNCREFSHLMVECPQKPGLTDSRRDHQWLRTNPNAWWWLGNGQQSAGWPRAMTPNAQPSHFTHPTNTSSKGKKDQFSHGPQIPSPKVPLEMKQTRFTPTYRWEPATNW